MRCRRPTGCGGSPGSVTSMRSLREPRVELGAPRAPARAPRSAPRAPGGPRWPRGRRRRAPRAAARRRRAGGSAARPCGRASGPAAPRAAALDGRRRSPASRLGADRRDPVEHRRAGTLVRARRARRSPPSRRSSTRFAIGMCAARVARRRRRRRQPVALGADDERHVRPRAGAAQRRAPARATSPIRVAGQLVDRRDARDAARAKIAPIDARTAFGPNGSAQPGPSATLAAPNASAPRSTVPTLPGSRTPQSATHSGPAGAASSAARRRRARASPSRARRPRSSAALDVDARPAAGSSGGHPAARRPRPGPRPRRRSASVARTGAGEPADLLELVVVGRGDQSVCRREQKGAVLEEAAPVRLWSVGSSRQRRPTPRGRHRQIGGRSRGRARRCRRGPCGPARCRPA